MQNKRNLFVIVTCIILLIGNIIGLLHESDGTGQWNLNKTLSVFADYYSFSFVRLYELERMWDFSPYPGKFHSFFYLTDWLLVILAVVTSIFFYETKAGRISLLCFLGLAMIFLVIMSIREYKLFDFIYRDYLSPTWFSGFKRTWYLNCLLPRAIYFILSGLSFYFVLISKTVQKSEEK